jgi:hypothetical protein
VWRRHLSGAFEILHFVQNDGRRVQEDWERVQED